MIPHQTSTLGTVDNIRATSRFRLIDTRHRGDLRLKRHSHERAGVTFVLQGGYREPHAHGELDCTAGSIVFKPAGMTHSNNYAPSGAHALHLEILDTRWDDERWQLPDRVVEVPGMRASYIAAQLRWEFQQRDAASQLALDAFGLQMISLLLRDERSAPATFPPAWLKQAKDLLHDPRQTIPTVTELAETVGIPARRLVREFQRHYGCSPGEYARYVRVEQAALALRDTDRPLSEIALDAGFCDQSHFCRVFKRRTNLTPGEYRQLHQR